MPELAEIAYKLMKSEDWREAVRRIPEACRRLLKDCEVYLFGSAAEGRLTGGSDVDVLVVVKKAMSNRDRSELTVRILEEAEISPFTRIELHVVSKEEAKWYFKHAKRLIRASDLKL